MIEVIILSLVQGITEFLPVSSSSHLIVFSKFLKFQGQNLTVDISLHIGSFLAVIVYFSKDIINFAKNKLLFLKVILASLPIIFIGYLLVKFNLIDQLRNIKTIGWTTLIFGILLFLSDRFETKKNLENNLTLKSIMFVGFMQVLSLIPGTSRSGITLTAARFLQFNRVDSAKISFLLSIPTLGAVSIFGLWDLTVKNNINFSILNLFAIFLSFIFSYITIRFLLNYLKKFSLKIFVFYRISLGVVILVLAYL
tara:strand:- start:8215 stop:8973 length:759 start_codon:yes stop_codon:yes gene_type:complete